MKKFLIIILVLISLYFGYNTYVNIDKESQDSKIKKENLQEGNLNKNNLKKELEKKETDIKNQEKIKIKNTKISSVYKKKYNISPDIIKKVNKILVYGKKNFRITNNTDYIIFTGKNYFFNEKFYRKLRIVKVNSIKKVLDKILNGDNTKYYNVKVGENTFLIDDYLRIKKSKNEKDVGKSILLLF